MGMTTLNELLAMKRSGEIDADEFALAVQYLREGSDGEPAGTAPQNGSAIWTLSRRLLKLVVGHERVARMAKPIRRLCTAGTLFAVAVGTAMIVVTAVSIITNWSFNAETKLYPVGSVLWTALILAACGWVVEYNRYVIGVLAVPLFLGLLLAPMWKGDGDSNIAAATSEQTVDRSSTRPLEWGETDHVGEMELCKQKIAEQVIAIYDWQWGRAWAIGERRIRKGRISFMDRDGAIREDTFTCTFDVAPSGNEYFIGAG